MKPWTNPLDRFDVNADGMISPIDAINVINRIGAPRAAPPFADVTGDGAVGPLDALQVINRLPTSAPVLAPPAEAPVASSLPEDPAAGELAVTGWDPVYNEPFAFTRFVGVPVADRLGSGQARRQSATIRPQPTLVDTVFAESARIEFAIDARP